MERIEEEDASLQNGFEEKEESAGFHKEPGGARPSGETGDASGEAARISQAVNDMARDPSSLKQTFVVVDVQHDRHPGAGHDQHSGRGSRATISPRRAAKYAFVLYTL